MRSLAALCLCACSFEHGVAQDGPIDTIDSPVDTPVGTNCYGPASAFRICLNDPPTGTFIVTTSATYNTSQCTDGSVVPQAGGPELCVRSAMMIEINATLTVTGTRPLVLLANGSLSVSAVITVSAGSN